MQKYVLCPPEPLFSRFTPLINFKLSAFFQTYFKLRNNFGDKPDLIKALARPGYLSFTSIQ